ncbi:MAG: hypothetical protein PHS37_00105 [Candidatus Omnitrophica bacterium]|nr:hypothetical protein [Candidatus Omnitrophota bacterium]
MRKVLAVVVVSMFVIGIMPAFANCGKCSGKSFFQGCADSVNCIGKGGACQSSATAKIEKAQVKERGTALTPKNKKTEAAPVK